jgi:hypothetical protein
MYYFMEKDKKIPRLELEKRVQELNEKAVMISPSTIAGIKQDFGDNADYILELLLNTKKALKNNLITGENLKEAIKLNVPTKKNDNQKPREDYKILLSDSFLEAAKNNESNEDNSRIKIGSRKRSANDPAAQHQPNTKKRSTTAISTADANKEIARPDQKSSSNDETLSNKIDLIRASFGKKSLPKK